MCRVNRKHTHVHRISTIELLHRTGLSFIDTYITRRQLRWAGHVARMDFCRLPRKMMSSWFRKKRPHGAPQYGRGLMKAMKKANIDSDTWERLASNREDWRSAIMSFR